jgi:glycosyltransferase involved in cell wall biosynthesis
MSESQRVEQPVVHKPKVAIIIATHNYGHFVRDAIESAINQDWPNIDIHVVDDNSTDETPAIIGDITTEPGSRINNLQRSNELQVDFVTIVKTRPLFYYRTKQNRGPSAARNIGILNAINFGAEYILVLDADDIARSTKVSELIKHIIPDVKKIAGAYADYTIWRLDSNTMTYENKRSYDLFELMQNCIIHSGSLISIEALKTVAFQRQGRNYPEFYDEDLVVCEDYNLWLRLAKKYCFIHIAKDLSIVRSHSGDSNNYRSQQVWQQQYQLAKTRALN